MKHPTILSIAAAHASFVLEDFSTREARFPLINDTVEIIRMNPSCPVPALDISEGTAQIFQPTAIEIIEIAIGAPSVDQGRDGIDHYVQIVLTRLQSLFSLFAFLDIGA